MCKCPVVSVAWQQTGIHSLLQNLFHHSGPKAAQQPRRGSTHDHVCCTKLCEIPLLCGSSRQMLAAPRQRGLPGVPEYLRYVLGAPSACPEKPGGLRGRAVSTHHLQVDPDMTCGSSFLQNNMTYQEPNVSSGPSWAPPEDSMEKLRCMLRATTSPILISKSPWRKKTSHFQGR